MRKGSLIILGGLAVIVIVSGTVICLKTINKKQKKENNKSTERSNNSEPQYLDSIEDDVEELKENKTIIASEMNDRHSEAAQMIREASEAIHSEEPEEEIEVDSVHAELKNLIDEL